MTATFVGSAKCGVPEPCMHRDCASCNELNARAYRAPAAKIAAPMILKLMPNLSPVLAVDLVDALDDVAEPVLEALGDAADAVSAMEAELMTDDADDVTSEPIEPTEDAEDAADTAKDVEVDTSDEAAEVTATLPEPVDVSTAVRREPTEPEATQVPATLWLIS